MFGGISKRELFRKVYDENFSFIYSFVYPRLGGNSAAAQDMVQEVFLAALKSFEKFKGMSSYSTWLCSIAKHKLIDYYRKTADCSIVQYDNEQDSDSLVDIENDILKLESKEAVVRVLDRMSPVYRHCLILKYMDDCTMKEIGDILGRTPKAVDGMLQRAKAEFKKEYIKTVGDESHE
jgi:RNA polymerase sigma factor, sigma-70 family